MSLFSKLGTALASLGKQEDKDGPEQIGHDSFTGSRFIVIALAILGLLWAPKFGIGSDLIMYGFWLVIAYIVSNTVTRTVQILVNGRLAQDFQAFAFKDGKLDENETKVISGRQQAIK